MPVITNLRLDPFERTGFPEGDNGSLSYFQFYIHEFWRFVLVQQVVLQLGQSFIDFPPMQKGASFNLEAVKAQILAAIKAQSD